MVCKEIVYIGELPPPYGGVTIKNKFIYEHIFKELDVEFIDVQECRRSPLKIPKILYHIIYGMKYAHSVIIGTSTRWNGRILLQLQLMLTGKRGMRKITKFVMGGRYQELVGQDLKLRHLLSNVGSIWVESEQMVAEFQKLGIKQTYLFPNCRTDNGSVKPIARSPFEPLRLVFFSKICNEKGVDIIMKAFDIWNAEKAPVTLDFYGEITADIKRCFERFIMEGHATLHYHGVFDTANGDVYKELNKYDAIVLPTRWKGEGVPGALIESKMAGITAIVSDWHINSEVIRDGIEGIVLSTPTADALAATVLALCRNPEKVNSLKQGAFLSRRRYCIETYRPILMDHVLR